MALHTKARSSKSGFIETLKGFYNIKHPSQKVFIEVLRRFSCLTRHTLTMALTPYRAPGTMAVLSHLEHNHGAFIMDKGMHQVVQSLVELGKELGVDYHTNSSR